MQIQISPETALREQLVENQYLKNRVLILAQQCADKAKRIAELEAASQPDEDNPNE
jgi:hypothetical protein